MKKSELIVNKGVISAQFTKNIRPILPKTPVDPTKKCFVCDHCIGNQAIPLLKASTPYSKISLPNKIGKLMGDDFVVLVSVEDSICLKCVDLFRNLDHLEEEVDKLRNTIVKFLKIKYQISDEHLQIDGPSVKIEKLATDTLKRKFNDISIGKNPNQEDIEQQLSNMFGSPVQIMTSNAKRKQAVQYFKCASCNFQTENLYELTSHNEKCKLTTTVLFKCSKCKMTFNDQRILSKHMREAHTVNYKCSNCNISFTSEGVLKSHIARKGCQRFACKACEFRTTDKKKYDEHEQMHVKKMFKCGICSQRFESKSHLNVHLKKHKAAYFKCGICSETFQKRDVLMKHLTLHSKPKMIIKENSNDMNGSTTTQSLLRASIEEALRIDSEPEQKVKDESKQIEFFSCTMCQLTFINESMYSQHMKTHESQTRSESDKNIKEESIDTNNSTIDLESIFEKLHSESNDDTKSKQKIPNLENVRPDSVESVLKQINDVANSENTSNSKKIVTTNVTKNEKSVLLQNGDRNELPETDVCEENENTIRSNNILVYKCGACDEMYNDSSHLQIHLLTTGHGDINSEIQILEIPDGSRLVENRENQTMIIQTEENGEIKLLSIDADTKLMSDGENILDMDSHLGIDGIKFIQTEENGEIKLITIDSQADGNGLQQIQFLQSEDNEVKFLSMSENNNSNNVFLEADNGEIKFMAIESNSGQMITTDRPMFDLKNNEEIRSTTRTRSEILDVETTDNSICELLQSVGVDSNTNGLTEEQVDRSTDTFFTEDNSKVQIIDDKKIELPHQILENSKDEEQDFNLDDLCNMTIKSEMHGQSQVSIV